MFNHNLIKQGAKTNSNRLKKLLWQIENDKKWKTNHNLYFVKLKNIEKDIQKILKKFNRPKFYDVVNFKLK
ncbi:MAG: hypothetical protein NC918_05770 [Candidatus Omnitrophica bacterium]|nr:hypothetical protein [Candidatus Omnitrophota bacterium]